MSWIEKLCQTYDNCAAEVGKLYTAPLDAKGNPLRAPRPLLPLYHTLQNAQIDITLDLQGDFIHGLSRVVEKADSSTVIPCTEASSGRTNTPAPHLLHDKLQYLAGDYTVFGGSKKHAYAEYLEQLQAFCAMPFAPPAALSVLRYMEKGTLAADLVADGILPVDAQGKVLRKWNGEKEDTPPIFRVCVNSDPIDCFVRISVLNPAAAQAALYRDAQLQNSWIAYCRSLAQSNDVCFVTGESAVRAVSHPKFVRNTGDGAKLISSNDSSGFTFRGRFETPEQAFSVGTETTAKAHNALKWLIDRQGLVNGDQVILCWGTQDELLPSPAADTFSLFEEPAALTADTEEIYAKKLRTALLSYGGKPASPRQEIVVMVLDSATPGRLSIPYYRELCGSEFFDRIFNWHTTCTWQLTRFVKKEGASKAHVLRMLGAPSLYEIAVAAYGPALNDKLKKAAIERLLPCVIDGARLPQDLVQCAVHRASNPACAESENEWLRTLDVTCALVRKIANTKHNQQEGYPVELSNEATAMDRSYLFGRILAYYDNLENWALSSAGENRTTSARRLMTEFCRKPAKTAAVLDRQLQPYLRRLGPVANGRVGELNALYAQLRDKCENGESAYNNRPLSETYLLGYRAQLNDFFKPTAQAAQEEGEN